MKLKFTHPQKKRNAVALLLITVLLAFYDCDIVYPYINYISSKLLFVFTAYHFVAIFAFFMIIKYGENNFTLRNTMVDLVCFSSLVILIILVVLKFPYSNRIFTASVIIFFIICSMELFIDTLIGIKRLIKELFH